MMEEIKLSLFLIQSFIYLVFNGHIEKLFFGFNVLKDKKAKNSCEFNWYRTVKNLTLGNFEIIDST